MKETILGVFTKPIHVEKIVNYLNTHTNIKYIISTNKQEVESHEFNIGISYCFPFIIKDLSKKWYNYHPAPLPKYKGLSNYSKPIKDKVKTFGVTLHEMTDKVDEGKVIQMKFFDLLSTPTNSNELGTITHYYLFQLFKETIQTIK